MLRGTPKRTPDLVHVSTFLQGGAGRTIVDLAVHQQAVGLSPVVLATRSEEPSYQHYPEHLARLASAGIPALLIDSTFKRDPGLLLHAARFLVDAVDPSALQLIHAHAATPSLVGILVRGLLQRRIPIVQTMHGWGIRKTVAQADADVAVLNSVDAVAAPSRAAGALLSEVGVTREITVVPCGLASDEPDTPQSPGVQLIARLKGQRCRVIACVGTLGSTKNQALLVDALPVIRASHDAVLVLIGEGPQEGLRMQSAARGVQDAVHCVGYDAHAAACIAAADVLVLPSRSESFGLSVVEAWRARTPVVVSDIPALAELVTDGVTGLIFRSDDPGDAARALSHVLGMATGARTNLVNAGHADFVRRFSLASMYSGYNTLYATCAPDLMSGSRAVRT